MISHVIGKLWTQPRQIVQYEDQEWINEALPTQLKLINDASQTNNYFNSEIMIEKRMDSMRTEQSFFEFNLQEFSERPLDPNWIRIVQTKGISLR